MTEHIDRELLAERSASVLAHLDRVAEHLPAEPADLPPMSSATDTVVLHLWQAVSRRPARVPHRPARPRLTAPTDRPLRDPSRPGATTHDA